MKPSARNRNLDLLNLHATAANLFEHPIQTRRPIVVHQRGRRLAALYTEDAISMPPNSPTISGGKAIQAEFESSFANSVARHETMVDQILERGGLTIEVGRYRLTYKPRSGGPEVVESGRHMEVRRRIDGQWKIVLEIWNSDTPIPK